VERTRDCVFDGPLRRVAAPLEGLGAQPGVAWALSWLAVFAGGLVVDPARGAAEAVAACVGGALFGAFACIGALGIAGRRAPAWIVPVVLGLGLARGAIFVAWGPGAAGAASLVFEPLTLAVAAGMVWRAGVLADGTALRLALAGSLAGLAALEVVDALVPLGLLPYRDTTSAWLGLGLLAAAAELAALRPWNAGKDDRLERAEVEQRALEAQMARTQQANALLRRREAWLFDFFETAPELLLVLAPGTFEILRCNRRFSESLGYARRQLVGRPILDFVAPQTLEAVRPVLAAHQKRLRNLLLHLVRRDGTELVVLANLALRVTADDVREVRAVLHDVTRIERARGPSDVHRALAEGIGVGVFHADAQGRCGWVNASFCELTGLSPAELRDRSWVRSVHPEERWRVEQAWDAAVASGTAFRAEHRVLRPTGGSLRVVTECVPLDDATVSGFAGSMTRVSGVGRITALDPARNGRAARGDGAPSPRRRGGRS